MSLVSLSNHLTQSNPLLLKQIVGKDPSTWVNTLDDNKLSELLEATVHSTPWRTDPTAQMISQAARQRLEGRRAQLSQETASRLDQTIRQMDLPQAPAVAQAAAPQGPAPKIATAKITKKSNCKELKGILKTWHEKAKSKDVQAKNLHLSRDKQKQAGESRFILNLMKSDMPKKVKNKTVQKESDEIPYVAYTADAKIQAVALRGFEDGVGQRVELLATSPDNVQVFGDEPAVRGAAKALMKHIVLDMVQEGSKGDLHLDSRPLAKGFYESLGFEDDKSFEYDAELPSMILRKEKFLQLLEKLKDVGIPTSNDPKLKKYKAFDKTSKQLKADKKHSKKSKHHKSSKSLKGRVKA